VKWFNWLPIALAIAGVGTALTLADAGRSNAALVLLGFSLAMGGVSVGYWLRRGDEEEKK